MALDADVKREIQAELDKLLRDLRRLQAMDMDAIVKQTVKKMLRVVRLLKVVVST